MLEYLCSGDFMSCEKGVCGTGDYSGPQPGDPSNTLSLSANAVFNGINVAWSYPTLNSFAVAHTILYRGVSGVFDNAIKLGVVGGSTYVDLIDSPTPVTYFYWVQIVSVNGTYLAIVGPASATSVPRSSQTMEDLTGRIDSGVLSNALKTQIASITLINGRISDEIQNRITSNAGLSAMIAAANGAVVQAMTYVQREITERTAGDSALVNSINTLGAAVGNNLALFQSEQTVRTSKDAAYVSNFSLLFTKVGAAAAAVTEETIARVEGYNALAQRVVTAESTVFGNTATGQIGLTTKINTFNGKITDIGALYTAKLSVNGLIGGFGVYNNGNYVEAGFDVDTFWIGRTNAAKVKPFIVSDGEVHIDKARIRNGDIDTLKIAGNSVMVGIYDSAGGATVNAGTSVNLISRTIDLGDAYNSGVIVHATVRLTALNNETVGFRIMINGVEAGDQRCSAREGYGILVPVSGFAAPNTRYATVVLQCYSPVTGTFDVVGSTMSIMGGKR